MLIMSVIVQIRYVFVVIISSLNQVPLFGMNTYQTCQSNLVKAIDHPTLAIVLEAKLQPLISVSITWYRTLWRWVWLQLYSPAYLFPHLLWSRSSQRLEDIRRQRATPDDIQYSPALNMRGQIAGATSLSHLLIYMNNCLQFCKNQRACLKCDFNHEYLSLTKNAMLML